VQNKSQILSFRLFLPSRPSLGLIASTCPAGAPLRGPLRIRHFLEVAHTPINSCQNSWTPQYVSWCSLPSYQPFSAVWR
jgi:hypothetical protein